MQDSSKAIEAVIRLFVLTDNRDWEGVELQFADQVNLNYSSMTGNPAALVTPAQITDGWKTVLPGFTFTQHQIGNFLLTQNADSAHIFCYGTATHGINDVEDGIWTVYGSYDFDLEYVQGTWKITSMTFNYNGQSGNTMLVQQAIINAKQP